MASEGVVKVVRDTAWSAAVKWGFGMVALVAISVVLGMWFDKQNTYIRETMAADSKVQIRVIEQNSVQLQQNSVQLQQNSEVLKSVLDNNETTMRVMEKALDKLEAK